jgi:hypothetical protein
MQYLECDIPSPFKQSLSSRILKTTKNIKILNFRSGLLPQKKEDEQSKY